MHQIPALWVVLRSSLWFVPALIVLGSMGVAHLLVEIAASVPSLSGAQLPKLLQFSAEGSRAMLSAIATAMITTAGVAFSITIVTLSLASTQYSPRVLQQFMRDRANQWVLGVFVGVFAYCLTVLPRVQGGEDNKFVPGIAVAVAVLYALIGVACLIFFIHHVAMSIQSSAIISQIAAETRASAEELFPDEIDACGDSPQGPAGPWQPVLAEESGYIRLAREADLVRLAHEHDLVFRMERGVGEFVVSRTPLLSVVGRLDPEVADKARAAFTINRSRTIEQDVMFGARQIADVALRALSPSLNDPTTATQCIDYLTTILHPLATRQMGRRCRTHEGQPRLIACAPEFGDLVAVAYEELREAAGPHALVYRAILRSIRLLEQVTRDRQRRALLQEQARTTGALVRENVSDSLCAELGEEAERLTRALAT